jgi:hypothetical protein
MPMLNRSERIDATRNKIAELCGRADTVAMELRNIGAGMDNLIQDVLELVDDALPRGDDKTESSADAA